MKKSNILLIMFAIFGIVYLWQNIRLERAFLKVVYRAYTTDESFTNVMDVIRSLSWFEQYGYNVTLPEHESFKKLYKNPDTSIKTDELKELFATEVYNKELLEKALQLVRKTEPTVKKVLEKFSLLNKNWGFNLLPKYEIVLSPFGIEGLYEWWTDDKTIVLLANPKKPLNIYAVTATIVHEMVHIGVDKTIVEKYNLTQWQKERLVDLICILYLKDVIPYYRPDDLREKNGDRRIDEFVNYDAIVNDLPAAIEKFTEKYLRIKSEK